MEEMEREKEPWKGPAPEEFLHLDHMARVWASQKIPNSSDAGLAADKAMEYLLNRYIGGNPPCHPYAWLKKAIDRLAMKWRQGKRGMRSLSEEDFQGVFSSVDALHYQISPPEEREWKTEARQYFESILPDLKKVLTKRQLLGLKVLRQAGSINDAAKNMGKPLYEPGNFILEIAKKAKKIIKK